MSELVRAAVYDYVLGAGELSDEQIELAEPVVAQALINLGWREDKAHNTVEEMIEHGVTNDELACASEGELQAIYEEALTLIRDQ